MPSIADNPSSRIPRKARVLIIILAVAIAFVFFYGPTDNMLWDPSFYYGQLRSPLIDHDLDLRNEVSLPANITSTFPTEIGLMNSRWPIGPGLLWSPFFLLTHLAVLLLSPAHANGIWAPYYAMVSAGSAFYGILGLILIFYICRRFTSRRIAWLTTFLCLFATPVFFYIFRQPLMSHSTGLASAAGLVLAYLSLEAGEIPEKYSGLILGFLIGLNFLIRWSGILLLIFPSGYYFHRFIQSIRRRDILSIRRLIAQAGIFILTGILTFSPQIIFWYGLHHRFLVLPQSTSTMVNSLLPINFFKVLIDTNRGILFWLPVACVGIAGLFLVKDRKLAWMSVTFMATNIILFGYRNDWYSGGGFGARYFIETLPIVCIGIITLCNIIRKRFFFKVLIGIISLILIVHQGVLVYSYEHSTNLNWFNIKAYFSGQGMGLSFQWDSLLYLVRHPLNWFTNRISVSTPRETLITNIMAGKANIKNIAFSLVGATVVPTLTGLFLGIQRKISQKTLLWLIVGGLLFMIAWTVFLWLIVKR